MFATLKKIVALLLGHRTTYAALAIASLAGCLGAPKDAKDWASFVCYLLLVLRR